MKKIKEISEFAKLFKINIPVKEHFEYYINTLHKSPEFEHIISLVNFYSEFEEWLDDNDFHNVGHYKMSNVFKKIKSHLELSQAYTRVQNFDYSKVKFYEKDNLKLYEGDFMLSLDFSSANFQSMKIFDYENNLKSNWAELCDSLTVHPMITSSKSFRQVVFGNLNPKRFQKISHMHLLKLVEELEAYFPADNIIFVSHDELVIRLGSEENVARARIEQIFEALHIIKENRIANVETWMDIHSTIFDMERVSKGIYVKTLYYLLDGSISELCKTLFGCPGNKYYINFKKHIIKEDIDERDCFFMADDELAKWVV